MGDEIKVGDVVWLPKQKEGDPAYCAVVVGDYDDGSNEVRLFTSGMWFMNLNRTMLTRIGTLSECADALLAQMGK